MEWNLSRMFWRFCGFSSSSYPQLLIITLTFSKFWTSPVDAASLNTLLISPFGWSQIVWLTICFETQSVFFADVNAMIHMHAERELRRHFYIYLDYYRECGMSRSVIVFERKLKAHSSLRNISKGASIIHAWTKCWDLFCKRLMKINGCGPRLSYNNGTQKSYIDVKTTVCLKEIYTHAWNHLHLLNN
jgi:hypothetical protein